MAVTGIAAPTNISQRRYADDEQALTRLFDRFERLQTVRWALNLGALACAVWVLVATLRVS
jgi:hypothetical protein